MEIKSTLDMTLRELIEQAQLAGKPVLIASGQVRDADGNETGTQYAVAMGINDEAVNLLDMLGIGDEATECDDPNCEYCRAAQSGGASS